ncbi:MAG: hypothetical protein ACPG9L_07225, partial [Crocinitomicaceae bacterium]
KHIITIEKTSTHTNNAVQNPEADKIEERIVPEEEAIVVEKNLSSSEVSSPKSNKVPYNKQYIVGCFAVKENALNYGFSPTISKSGKLYRVSMGITYSKEEYDRLIANVISKGYKGWTLKQ